MGIEVNWFAKIGLILEVKFGGDPWYFLYDYLLVMAFIIQKIFVFKE